MSGVKLAAHLLEVASVTVFALIAFVFLVATTLLLPTPAYRERPIDREVKSHLHEIQLAVEKYAVDHAGVYPAYLVGGEARWSEGVDTTNHNHPFSNQVACPELNEVADPLLREGYLVSYPRNPFAKNGLGVHQAQLSLPLNASGGDPLRNGVDTGRQYGTRFGAYCTSMGQLLGAKYYMYTGSRLPDREPNCIGEAPIPGLSPGADLTYPCWDVWTSSKARNPMPGQFIYAVMGPASVKEVGSATGQVASEPAKIDDYVLGAFGGPKISGMPILDATGNPFHVSGRFDDFADGINIVLTAAKDSDPQGVPKP